MYAFVSVFVVGVLLVKWLTTIGGPDAVRKALGPYAPLITVPVQVVVAVSPLPSDGLCVANGAALRFLDRSGPELVGLVDCGAR